MKFTVHLGKGRYAIAVHTAGCRKKDNHHAHG